MPQKNLQPFNFDHILKHRKNTKANTFAKIANDALPKKPVERLELDSDQVLHSFYYFTNIIRYI